MTKVIGPGFHAHLRIHDPVAPVLALSLTVDKSDFSPAIPTLNQQNPIVKGHKMYSGMWEAEIISLRINRPNGEIPGSLTGECLFRKKQSDFGTFRFTGAFGNWTLEG